jgi:hypothetical protein
MEGYLYISYDTDGLLKESKLYDDLDQIKAERGIGIPKEVIARTRVASFSSTDGSGCYVLDFVSEDYYSIDTTHSKHITPMLTVVLRNMRIESIGIE